VYFCLCSQMCVFLCVCVACLTLLRRCGVLCHAGGSTTTRSRLCLLACSIRTPIFKTCEYCAYDWLMVVGLICLFLRCRGCAGIAMAHAHSRTRKSGLNGPWRGLQCCGEPGLVCLVMSGVYCILGYISDSEICDDAMVLFCAFVCLSLREGSE